MRYCYSSNINDLCEYEIRKDLYKFMILTRMSLRIQRLKRTAQVRKSYSIVFVPQLLQVLNLGYL
jgi:hypothetical protein